MSQVAVITAETLASFRAHLVFEEKSEFTINKYLRDAAGFAAFLGGQALTKEQVLAYKAHLMARGRYLDSSVNSILSSIRALLQFLGRGDCAVKNLRIQEMPFNPEEKCLTGGI